MVSGRATHYLSLVLHMAVKQSGPFRSLPTPKDRKTDFSDLSRFLCCLLLWILLLFPRSQSNASTLRGRRMARQLDDGSLHARDYARIAQRPGLKKPHGKGNKAAPDGVSRASSEPAQPGFARRARRKPSETDPAARRKRDEPLGQRSQWATARCMRRHAARHAALLRRRRGCAARDPLSGCVARSSSVGRSSRGTRSCVVVVVYEKPLIACQLVGVEGACTSFIILIVGFLLLLSGTHGGREHSPIV